MKKIVSLLLFFAVSMAFAQSKNARTSLVVDGVCGMCKERIEKASIKTKGVKSAIWNVETHELKLIYNAKKADLGEVKQNILAVGHDVNDLKASDEAYNSVHACCRYRDEAVKDDHKKEKDQ
ncbi:heavy-metal-associated domain-containing protein [Mesonia sp. HuA40]|uniref:heavy-metal-associated domain-containing protein n=1 Tax=Mesonia sp. HuA40 TaxID=2602761 RepID=UPI00164FBF83|nr:ATPase [Mesonia sp. HuA40]